MPRKGKRQTLMFSATFPDAIQRAASNFLDNYLFLKIGLIGSANSDVTQSIFRCHKFEKRETLLSIFKDLQKIEKTLIFVQQKKIDPRCSFGHCSCASIERYPRPSGRPLHPAWRSNSRFHIPVALRTICPAYELLLQSRLAERHGLYPIQSARRSDARRLGRGCR